jgi:hypothetical protein
MRQAPPLEDAPGMGSSRVALSPRRRVVDTMRTSRYPQTKDTTLYSLGSTVSMMSQSFVEKNGFAGRLGPRISASLRKSTLNVSLSQGPACMTTSNEIPC